MFGTKHPADGSGELAALEETCPDCEGKGRIGQQRQGKALVMGGKCAHCKGTGGILTDDDRRLLEFIRRYGG